MIGRILKRNIIEALQDPEIITEIDKVLAGRILEILEPMVKALKERK